MRRCEIGLTQAPNGGNVMNGILKTMSALGVAFSATLALSDHASAITFKSVFYGAITWVNVSHCPNQQVGYTFNSEYHPRVASPASENFSAITTMYTFEGAIYRLNGAPFTSSFQPVSGIYTAGWYPIQGTQIRVLQSDPATVTSSTQYLSLRGQIKAPWGEQGTDGQPCIIGFVANYFRGNV